MMSEHVSASVKMCPTCHSPLVVIDGKPDVPVTLWRDATGTHAVVHAEDCPERGKAV